MFLFCFGENCTTVVSGIKFINRKYLHYYDFKNEKYIPNE